MVRKNKFVTEMILNVDCQRMGIFVIIFFLTFRLPTLLTNVFVKDKNIKFSSRKYKKMRQIYSDVNNKLYKREVRKK